MEYSFLRNALIGAVLTSIIAGIIGTIIIENKMVMMSGGIAHTAFGGIGLGYFLNFEPIIGALLFSIAAAFSICEFNRKSIINSDAVIGLFWSLGMALGIMFISFTPGYPPDMSSYLFGNILTVSKIDIYLMILLSLIICIVITLLFKYIEAYLFDEEYARIIGVNTKLIEQGVFLTTAVSIVVLIRVAGIILVLALLTGPALIAKQFTNKFKKILIYSIIIGVIFCVLGLFVSYYYNIPSGATIIIIMVMTYFFIELAGKIIKKKANNTKSERTLDC